MQITDGKNTMGVDDFGNALTRSITRAELNNASDQEKAFSWVSTYTTAGGNEVVAYIKNDHTTSNLEIHQIIAGTAANAVFTINKVTGTAAGTTISAENLNLKSGISASATSYGNAEVTGLSLGGTLGKIRVIANYADMFDLQGAIIVPPGYAIAISNSATGAFDITVIAHYNDLGTS